MGTLRHWSSARQTVLEETAKRSDDNSKKLFHHKNGSRHATDQRITKITTLSKAHYEGQIFIDATYEGDLMAAAGVSYHVGREPNSTYNETWNGVQIGVLHHGHHFGTMNLSPYVIPGDPTSGLLPRISSEDPGKKGEGDQ